MNEVIVVIPVYKEFLSETEKTALMQARIILKNYPICLMAPEKMHDFLTSKFLKTEFFPDYNFINIMSYSKLLLNPEFYQRFVDYNYILIYQLDAFVFYDKLNYFCSLNYDYIGSPMSFSWQKYGRVGNGGLSLRKVSSCIRVTENFYEIATKEEDRKIFINGEDKFFSYCGKSIDIDFHTPNVMIANQFAIMYNISHCYERLSENNLPFGCHGWSKRQHFLIWRPYIKKIIGDISKIDREIFKEEIVTSDEKEFIKHSRKYVLMQYLLMRIMRNSRDKAEIALKQIIPINGKYIIWGKGVVGNRAHRLLKFLDREIVCIFDKKAKPNEVKENLPVKQPDIIWAKEHEYKIIIAMNFYLDEISNLLKNNDWKVNEQFFTFDFLINYLIKNYYIKIWNNIKLKGVNSLSKNVQKSVDMTTVSKKNGGGY